MAAARVATDAKVAADARTNVKQVAAAKTGNTILLNDASKREKQAKQDAAPPAIVTDRK